MFTRAIGGKDIATGQRTVRGGYKTVGTAKSTYREGNATVQFEVLPTDDTYNTTTNVPNPVANTTSTAKAKRAVEVAGRRSKRLFKPLSKKVVAKP